MKCIEDEIPFELPEGWEWTRLGDIGNWQSGATPSRRHPEYYGGTIPWLKTGDLNDGFIDSVPEYITEEGMNNSSVVLNPIGSVLIAMYGATIGKLGITNIEVTTNQACCACLPLLIHNKYLFYFLMYQKEYFIKQAVGGAQPNISKEKIVATMFPIPPLSEQKRIIDTINNLLSKIDSIAKDKETIANVITKTKSKILDLAIRGQLVPQDPNDEPASVLLERIRAEKEELIKVGKIKRDKKESIIFRGEDNSYYDDIPDNWAICSLKELFNVCSAKRVRQSDWKTDGVPFYRAREIVKLSDDDAVSNELFISEEHYMQVKEENGVPKAGDLMVSGVGTIGKIYVVKEEDRFYYKDASVLCFENRTGIIDSQYARYMLESDFIQNQMKANSKGTTVDTITISAAMEYICILPPLAEQKRIVATVQNAFAYLNLISESMA